MTAPRLFTPAWGTYVETMAWALAVSLRWPRNLAALRESGVTWEIYTLPEDVDRCRRVVETMAIPTTIHLINRDDDVAMLNAAALAEATACVAEGRPLVVAMPDHVWGDGSVGNLLALGAGRDICVAVPHVRVNAETFVVDEPLDNAALVGLSWQHLHKTWIDADGSLPETNTYNGGVVWNRVGGLIVVQHRLPSCFLAHLRETDLDWLRRWGFAGGWDHVWPRKLVAEERWRVVGSSDAVFVAELTAAADNHPETTMRDAGEPDRYNGDSEADRVNRCVVAVWRAVRQGNGQ